MISIIEHIEYLAAMHDCVVIPDWGALIAQHLPATISDDSDATVTPPRRELVFNPEVRHNDGLLATSIARREGVTFDEALRVIAANVTVFKQFVTSGSELPMGRLGYFSQEDEGTLHFHPFARSGAGWEFFGLREFTFSQLPEAIAETETEPATAAVVPLTTEDDVDDAATDQQPPQRPSWWVRMGRYAAAIVLLIGLTLVLSTPITFTNGSQQQYASISVPEIRKAPTPKPVTQPAAKPAIKPQPTAKPAAPVAKADTATAAKADTATAAPVETGRYILVVSTLNSERQARAFIAEHKDLQGKARISRKGKRYRVYVERSDNYGDLLQKAYNLPTEYGTGWVAKV